MLLFLLLALLFLWAQTRLDLSLQVNLILSFFILYVTTDASLIAVIAWFIWVSVAVFYLAIPLRKKYISSKLYQRIKKVMPPISDTERAAIDAGTVWWEADLFQGNPDFNKLLKYQKPTLTQQETEFLEGPVNELCELIDDWQITHELQDLPENVWQFLKDKRFFGMIIPKEYGGLEFSAHAHSEVVMKISSRSLSSAVTVMVPNSLGPAELLLHYGTEQQKNYYLPRLADGRDIPCFALTGPNAGSDAGSIPDTGVVCYQTYKGQKTLGFLLNWEKRYITLGPVATILGLAFKAYDPDGILGDKEALGITCALIPTDTKGITIGNRHMPLNAAFQNGPNEGKDVFIPMDWLIGGQEKIGEGWKMLVESLSAGRGISLPALSAGAGKHALRTTGAYARIRKQFKTSVGKFEGVEEAIANLAGKTYLMNAGRLLTLSALDSNEKPSVITAILKYHNTEMMRDVVNNAMDIHGGRGICMGPSNYMARPYQTVPVGITVEGANILTRSMIIFGQGAMRCHPWLIKEIEAVNHKSETLGKNEFDVALLGHIAYLLKNISRALIYGISASHLAKSPVGGRAEIYYKRLSQMSAAFAVISDLTLMILGGKFKRKEKLSGRFADALSHMFYVSAALKQYADDSEPNKNLPVLEWSCKYSLYQTQIALDEILRNYPSKIMGLVLRVIVFPLGLSLRLPNDGLGHRVAAQMIKNSVARDNLTKGLYINTDENDITGRLEDALKKVELAEPIEKRLRAQKEIKPDLIDEQQWHQQLVEKQIINDEEKQILKEASEATRRVIMVDDFAINSTKTVVKKSAKKKATNKKKAIKKTKKEE